MMSIVVLSAGIREVNITFNNDAYNESTGDDRNLYIDAVEIYRDDQLISMIEGENFESTDGFHKPPIPMET